MTSQDARPSQHAALPAALFRAWVARAKPGERLEYHQGFLTVDRSPGSRLAEHERRLLTTLAGAALSAAEADQVHLVQRRNGPADFSYLAIKARPDPRSAVAALPVVTTASTTPPDFCLGSSG
jgi:hypothetical protein